MNKKPTKSFKAEMNLPKLIAQFGSDEKCLRNEEHQGAVHDNNRAHGDDLVDFIFDIYT